jgi:hypothetical protein
MLEAAAPGWPGPSPLTCLTAQTAGLYIAGGDPRSYRSIDPLETKGSANYAASSLPGRNGFLGGATSSSQQSSTSQYLYCLFSSGEPNGSGDGEWCVHWWGTTTVNNAVSGNVALRACELVLRCCGAVVLPPQGHGMHLQLTGDAQHRLRGAPQNVLCIKPACRTCCGTAGIRDYSCPAGNDFNANSMRRFMCMDYTGRGPPG